MLGADASPGLRDRRATTATPPRTRTNPSIDAAPMPASVQSNPAGDGEDGVAHELIALVERAATDLKSVHRLRSRSAGRARPDPVRPVEAFPTCLERSHRLRRSAARRARFESVRALERFAAN